MENEFEDHSVKYKILVNATTFQGGGGIQVGLSFIEFVCKVERSEFEFIFAVSEPLFNNLSTDLQKDKRITICKVSPARILRGRQSRIQLKKIEKTFMPDIVYSISFPSYVRFNGIEVARFTNPWEMNPPPLPWHTLSLSSRIHTFWGMQYRLFWASRAKFFDTQIESGRDNIIRKLKIPENQVKVIPNCPNQLFFSISGLTASETKSGSINIFCLSAAYPHKNLSIIPEVAYYLKTNHNLKCNFILTIPENSDINKKIKSKSRRFDVIEMITNVGVLKLNECIEYFKTADIIFLPTLLEVFSATYVEAMAMARPIVTTDLPFAHEVCGNAALYYSPRSAENAAESISLILNNEALRQELVQRGIDRLATFPTPDEKHQMLLDWLSEIINRLRTK